MFRRLPFLPLSFAALVGVFALTSLLTAQPPTTDVPTGTGVKRNQEENLKFYKNFAEQVLRLAQKWEKSDSIEDKERAKTLRAALKLAEEKGLEKLFKDIIEGLNGKNPNFDEILGKDKKLIAALTEILNLLETEDDAARIREEIKRIEDAIKAINELKRKQENILGRTFNPKSDADKLAKDQADLKNATDAVAKALAKAADPNAKPGQPNAGAKEDPKSENKAEPKPGENTAENKPDTKENKADTKADGMGMGGMPMDPKGAGAEAKPMGGMGMPMDGMSGGDKPAPKDGMSGGDPKGGEPKPMGGMPTDPKNPMGMNPMGGEPKPSSGEGKPQGAGKAESKPSAGMPGGEGKPMGSEGMGGMGMPMGGMGQPSPGGSKGGGSPPPGGQQPPPQGGKKDPAAENVQQAVPSQQEAEDNIKKNENKNATKNQDDAIRKLEEAIKELEARLKQLREKELAKLLANLEQRVSAMIRMQTEVQASTKNIHGTVKALGGKPAVAEIQKSQAEAENENKIIVIADATLKLMEGEGSAVVFAGVLKEVKGDMEAIQKRLNEARVGDDTQQIEQDVIDQLKLMLEALKKAKQDLENKPSDPKPSDPNAKKQDNKLLEMLAELKLIKALQEQVNKRTLMHSKTDPNEQAKDPLIQAELIQLAARQKVLQDMLHKIATQANQ